MATTANAQDANQVTLKFDDGEGVSGQLLGFEDGIFRLRASVGRVSIPAQDVFCIGAACPEGTELEIPPAPVTLASPDGSLRVSGDLLEFTNGTYVVATNVGELRIEAEMVTCEGDGCPPAAVSDPADRKVALMSDGDVVLEGELLGIEDGVYLVDLGAFGVVRADVNAYECRGEACP
ncbi:MAG: hypothetical protein AAF919_02730 [Pseudomonadota bacterium]